MMWLGISPPGLKDEGTTSTMVPKGVKTERHIR